jgi:hypothetical protein
MCLPTEGKARKNLSQGSQRDSKYAHYEDTYTLQNQPIHTHTHTHTHTLQNSLKPPQYKLKQTQYKIYPNEIIKFPHYKVTIMYIAPDPQGIHRNSHFKITKLR